jgi:hypothetical protein
MTYSFTCACGITIATNSDSRLASAVLRHELGSQIHYVWQQKADQ